MTTIAYRHGQMVADTMCTAGNFKMKCTTKIAKTAKYLIGMSGNVSMFVPFVYFLSNIKVPLEDAHTVWKDVPEFGDIYAVIADREGNLWSVVNQPPIKIEGMEYYAIGSGSDYALGAMAMGACAERAIWIAATFDPNTSNDTVSASFDLDSRSNIV